MNRKRAEAIDPATRKYMEACIFISKHPMFSPLAAHAYFFRKQSGNLCPEKGWAVVSNNGTVYIHPTRRAETDEWIYVLAHCLLHLGFGHFQKKHNPMYWNVACDVYVSKFLDDMKLGKRPGDFGHRIDYPVKSEEQLYENFLENGIPETLKFHGTAGDYQPDIVFQSTVPRYGWNRKVDWESCLAKGLSMAVTKAVKIAAGQTDSLLSWEESRTPAQKARNWFIDHYPLLGALASGFKLIEDPAICQRLEISIAAIDVTDQEIYLNPSAGLDEEECKFVIAHELLHAGLRHHERCQGRDHYLWNVACDYVINQWLVNMHVGEIPQVGILLDEELKGHSAESIYDRMVTDIRTYRKLQTLRGPGGGDILDKGRHTFWDPREGVSLDDFCISALQQGLVYHQETGRGFLPAGLIEEIKALGQPAIKWDVELAKWFDRHFSPLEKVRTYARVSRRQSSTPDIARPKWVDQGGDHDGRTFGVVLDTSRSMDKKLLAKALGAIASYALARDVPAARVVFCDAVAYDEGYMKPEDIADKVKVKGRGGTILQPGIDLLQQAEDFPKNGPILIITDGYCDKLYIKRDHAYIMPKGMHLPFVPKGPVFRID